MARYDGYLRNPLRPGWSREVISHNIGKMKREGYAQDQAVAASLDSARRSFRGRHPRAALPAHLKDMVANAKKPRIFVPARPPGRGVGMLGDVNPIEYGGGVVVETEYGPMIEYTFGLE